MTTFDHALRTLETAERRTPPNRAIIPVPYAAFRTAIQALRTCRAVQIACNACDGPTRLRLWGSIERELMADAGMEVTL